LKPVANSGQIERTDVTEEKQVKKLTNKKVLAVSKRLVSAFSKHNDSFFLSWINKERLLKEFQLS